jgi:ABC-type transport system involved in cytochrome bd biosynthesis fused ATPase/permease subunit
MSAGASQYDRQPAAQKPLLSNSSILILSGLLLGIVLTQIVPDSFRFSATMGGIVGIIAYVVLQSFARIRDLRARAQREELVAMKLEGKVARHVLRSMPDHKRSPRQSRAMAMRQYLPVTPSPRTLKHPQR